MVKPSCSNFSVITANFSDVRIFRIFTVKLLLFAPQDEDVSFFSFVRGTKLFPFSPFHQRKNRKS